MQGSLKRRIYRAAMGKAFTGELDSQGRPRAVQASTVELLSYMWRKGGPTLLRGLLVRWRLGSCGGRLFWGRGVQLLFPGYLHVGHNVAIGDHCYLSCLSEQGVHIGDNVRIKEYVRVPSGILTSVMVGLRIGDNTYIGPYCTLGAGGGLTIGNDVTIGAHVDLLAEDHNFNELDRPINQQGVWRRGIVVEDDCWIGNRVIVLDGVTIGRGAVVGAGSVVTRSVPPYSIVVGNPARVLRVRAPAHRSDWELETHSSSTMEV